MGIKYLILSIIWLTYIYEDFLDHLYSWEFKDIYLLNE